MEEKLLGLDKIIQYRLKIDNLVSYIKTYADLHEYYLHADPAFLDIVKYRIELVKLSSADTINVSDFEKLYFKVKEAVETIKDNILNICL